MAMPAPPDGGDGMNSEIGMRGIVHIVGAGPGAPDLLTLRARDVLRRADVVLYDRLVDPAVLRCCARRCELLQVGKRAGAPGVPQEEINGILVRLARAGRRVVRLKCGDPFVFGRGGEEVAALRRAGVRVAVVPGVTAALAAAAELGVPLTERDTSASVTFVTGRRRDGVSADTAALSAGGTVCVYMGLERLADVARSLVARGLPPATPVAVVQSASRPSRRVVRATLATVVERVAAVTLGTPAVLIVGRVVALGDATTTEAPTEERTGMQKVKDESGFGRRTFLRRSALAALLAGMPRGWVGGAWASDAPETTQIRFGIIALTDCAPIVMAHELGLLKKHGIESTISKEASWAVIRDKLALGENQATHMLYGMPYASTLGLLGSPKKPMIIPFGLDRNGQGITLSRSLLEKGIKTPAELKPAVEAAKAAGTPMTFAMTFPPGTHAMWMRYWLASGGINPDKDVTLITIPPPQMVANMKVGKMDGFCVGEPWNARAIADGIGFTAIATQGIWRDHPEKVLGFTAEFAEKNPRTVQAILRAMLESAQWCEQLENRPELAQVVSRPEYINTAPESILGRLVGDYDYGDGRTEKDPYYMTFFARDTTFPLKSHGVWWLSQFRRWGMIGPDIDYRATVDRVHRPDLWRAAAKGLGLPAPAEDSKTETLFDGVAFDPRDPERYALAFPVHSRTA
jgi:nitrate/nitrite transport system substrate-binding protein